MMKSTYPRISANQVSGDGRWKKEDGFQPESSSDSLTAFANVNEKLPSASQPSSSPPPLNLHLNLNLLRAPRGAAFSLTEVVIALGIFAVSMVGVLALFPVASSAGRESSEETQAAILAETVLGDLRSSTSAKGKSAGWIVRGPNTFTNQQWIKPINLTVRSNYFILYDLISRTNSSGPDGVGMIGNPIALKAMTTVVNESTYSNAVNSAGAIYGSQVAIEPVSSITGLAAVTVTVNSPVSMTSTNRRSYSFSTLIFAP